MKSKNEIIFLEYLKVIETIEKPFKLKEVASILDCSDRILINVLKAKNIKHKDIINKKFPTFCNECGKQIDFFKQSCSKSCSTKKRNSLNHKESRKNFKEIVLIKNPNIELLEPFINSSQKILCKCLDCGHIWRKNSPALLKGKGCPICNGGIKYTLERFVQLVEKSSPNFEILDIEYIPSKKSKIKCKNCGNIFFSWKGHLLKGATFCNSCNRHTNYKSRQEEKIENFLILKNINYFFQKTYPDLKGKNKASLRFDFYLPEFNMCIEYDGEGHFDKNYFRNKGSIDHTNDIKKENYCNDHNIKLLRIPFWERKDMIEYLDLILDELTNFNSIITNNYRGKEYSHLIGN